MSPQAEARRDWISLLPTLTTGDLTLREACGSDAAALCRHLATDEVGRLMTQPPATPEGFDRFIEWAQRERVAGRGFCYAIHPAGSREAVGLIQARALESGYGITEWGFCIGHAYWGTGIFSRAASLLADFLFRNVGVRRVEARVVLPNGRAAGALRKLGAAPEGILRRGIDLRGEQLDQTLWSLDRVEWLSRVVEPFGTIEPDEGSRHVDPGPPRQSRGEWSRNPPTLTADRCTLRELIADDAPVLSDLLSAPAVARFLQPPPNGVEGFEHFIMWTQRQRQEGRSIALGIVPRGMAHAVGFFQLHSVGPQFATAEWGFALGEPYWGSGLFAASAELMLHFIFESVRVRRLEARSAVDNIRANGALRKVGATPECYLRRSFLVDDRGGDDLLWSLLDDEWRGRPRIAGAEDADAARLPRQPVGHVLS
jgi:[ribosomal protein S5]-alanine N-acetyltransferase